MKTFVLKSSAFAVMILLTITLVTSCKKDKVTKGTVMVTNVKSAPVSGAKVHLSANSANGKKTYDATTDPSGKAEFEIDLPAIWDVTVVKDSLLGTGVLRLDEPGKKTTVTIIARS